MTVWAETRSNVRPATHTTKNFTLVVGTTTPTGGKAGYEPGCRFVNESASGVDMTGLYINVGTGASCDFDPIQQLLVDSASEFFIKDEAGDKIITTGDTSVLPSGAGYMKNAFYVNRAGAASTSMDLSWYINIGGTGTADFKAITLTVAS